MFSEWVSLNVDEGDQNSNDFEKGFPVKAVKETNHAGHKKVC